jgi:hypothetical protein
LQTQGSLQESSLASLLQTMQTERATGALSLESRSDNASLFFLFGHLFHAQSQAGQGEDVVIDALGWHDGRFRFDPRAKLPPEETIKSSPAELIAEAERRVPGGSMPEEQRPWDGQADYGEAGPAQYDATAYEAAADQGYPEPAWQGQAPEPTWETPAPEPAWEAPAPEPEPETPAYSPWVFPAPEPAGERAEYEPPSAPSRAPAGHQSAAEPVPGRAPGPLPASEPVPAPARARAASGPPRHPEAPPAAMGAATAPELDIVYPLPAGRTQYEGLKSAFVDFPKLLRTLRGDQHTGYVRLEGADFSAILLFKEGLLLDALSSGPGGRSGVTAFDAVHRSMDAGTSTLDVVDLPVDLVDALSRLLAAPLLYTGLLGRFVNFEGLLAHLADEKADGAVVVVGASDVGVILLTEGQLLGAYTRSNPVNSNAPTAVAKIASEKSARIEVKSGGGAVTPLDVEGVLAQRY